MLPMISKKILYLWKLNPLSFDFKYRNVHIHYYTLIWILKISCWAYPNQVVALKQRKSLLVPLMDDTDLQKSGRCHAVTVGGWQTQLEWKVSASAS